MLSNKLLDAYCAQIIELREPNSGGFFYSENDLREVVRKALEIFRHGNGFLPNLIYPRTFNEFIFNRKFIYSFKNTIFSSKTYLSRYVNDTFGKYGSDIVSVFYNSNELKIQDDDETYFLKGDHGSGMNERFTRSSVSLAYLIDKADVFIAKNFGYEHGEWQYGTFPPSVLIERALTVKEDPLDYRFYCFGGSVKIIEVNSQSYQRDGRKITFFTPKWDLHNIKYQRYDIDTNLVRPSNLDELIHIAEKLAARINDVFIRLDLYNVENNPVVGEATFTPTNGWLPFQDDSHNLLLGDMWRDFIG